MNINIRVCIYTCMDCTNHLQGLLVSTQGSPGHGRTTPAGQAAELPGLLVPTRGSPGHGRTTPAGQAAGYAKIFREKQKNKTNKDLKVSVGWWGGHQGPKPFVFLFCVAFLEGFVHISDHSSRPGSWICKNPSRKAKKNTKISRYQWDGEGIPRAQIFCFFCLFLLFSKVFCIFSCLACARTTVFQKNTKNTARRAPVF